MSGVLDTYCGTPPCSNCATCVSSLWAAAVVSFAPLVAPVNVVEDVVAVKRALRNLIQTNFYERPFQPELGCGIRELLFENFTPMTKVFLETKIEEVIINYEPRVQLQNVAVDDDQDKNRLVVDIYFYVVGVPGPQVVQTFLQRVR